MAHQNAQQVAIDRADLVDRAAQLRSALARPAGLREQAERLLDAVPDGCDVLAWSPEGFSVALVASVLAEQAGRELIVHRASLVAPLAQPLRDEAWTWLCAEEVLGFGAVRGWAAAWAAARRGSPLSTSRFELVVVQ